MPATSSRACPEVGPSSPQRPALSARPKESCRMSEMREAMCSQPDELARLVADLAPAEAAASADAGGGFCWSDRDELARRPPRRLDAGRGRDEAERRTPATSPPTGEPSPRRRAWSSSPHRRTGYSMTMLERAQDAGAETLHISGIGNGGGSETVAAEAVVRLHRQPHGRACRSRAARRRPWSTSLAR